MAGDWREIQDDREKYAAYLCSREWAVLKEAVHQRAGGVCERCHFFPIDAVHHTTYERKYQERLEDLQGNCKHCHAFTHGKGEFDPTEYDSTMIAYIQQCQRSNLEPAPHQIGKMVVRQSWRWLFCAIDHLVSLYRATGGTHEGEVLLDAAKKINAELPFDILWWKEWRHPHWNSELYRKLRGMCGYVEWVDVDIADNPESLGEED
jgi:hypothetical protein